MITQKRLKELLYYNPNTGIWLWIKNFKTSVVGTGAGYIDEKGYRIIKVDQKRYKASRLAWLYMTGEFPKGQIDHIDRNRTNDKWDNLREVTPQQNAWNNNLFSTNSSGKTGIYQNKKSKRWIVQIHVNKKGKHIGSYLTKEEAIVARLEAEKTYYGEYRPDGKTDNN